MESGTEAYLTYIATARRFSPETVTSYREVLEDFLSFISNSSSYDSSSDSSRDSSYDSSCDSSRISPNTLRAWELDLLDRRKLSARTVNHHMSVLSSYFKFLLKKGLIQANPIRSIPRPKQEKRLPTFYREDSMSAYFESHKGTIQYGDYEAALRYLTVSLLYGLGLRRAELISLNNDSVDFARMKVRVTGKGDKTREIPLTETLASEITAYLDRKSGVIEPDAGVGPKLNAGVGPKPDAPLLLTKAGGRLYPVLVDRYIKRELADVPGITCRRSPHVLRHTVATQLLDGGADINSIKEMLGHSSLAATQVYTHTTVERLQAVYRQAHPRSGQENPSSGQENPRSGQNKK